MLSIWLAVGICHRITMAIREARLSSLSVLFGFTVRELWCVSPVIDCDSGVHWIKTNRTAVHLLNRGVSRWSAHRRSFLSREARLQPRVLGLPEMHLKCSGNNILLNFCIVWCALFLLPNETIRNKGSLDAVVWNVVVFIAPETLSLYFCRMQCNYHH